MHLDLISQICHTNLCVGIVPLVLESFLTSLSNPRGVLRHLVCNAQKYDWGRKGHQSKVALYKQAQDSEFQINENESYAELWMG